MYNNYASRVPNKNPYVPETAGAHVGLNTRPMRAAHVALGHAQAACGGGARVRVARGTGTRVACV